MDLSLDLLGIDDTEDFVNVDKLIDNINIQSDIEINICPDCQLPFESNVDLTYSCKNCGLTVNNISNDCPNNENNTSINNQRIRRANIIKEMLFSSEKFRQEGGNSLDNDLIIEAAILYDSLSSILENTTRNNNKKRIQAGCISNICRKHGFVRSESDICGMVGLTTSGFSSGTKLLLDLKYRGKLNDIEDDHYCIRQQITTYFDQLGLMNNYKDCIDIVYEIVDIAINKAIIYNTHLSSKCIGAIYLLSKKGLFDEELKLDFISKKCNIKDNTIKSTAVKLDKYRSHFVEIYENNFLPTNQVFVPAVKYILI
jgi:hypothetical protein